ncbi:MAG: DUF4738 domain-containing protein [Bacteroidetes bacterium]|nr:DUF4738 domain-containing protein [Bacteroidota bacterium]MBS1741112.1 DUF4738 domain-containing protein [Bacteroidota bacterium]
MPRIIIIFLTVLVFASCKQTTTNKPQRSANETSDITGEQTPDIKKLRQDYILSYSKPTAFESFNKGKEDEKLKVWGKYYCLFDNAIVVPGKYNFDDTTKNFTTHNFAEDIVITSNGDTIIKTTISKNDFRDKLPQYLKNHAVMFEPKFEGYDPDRDAFDFSFSVSIPLTDVGLLMNLSLKRNGQITVRESE